ncbi:hypothetical protein X975_13013, partial [Stegodyphus mimosarum]
TISKSASHQVSSFIRFHTLEPFKYIIVLFIQKSPKYDYSEGCHSDTHRETPTLPL